MADFTFKAYAKDGSLVADRVTASSRSDAVRQITVRGLAPFEVREGAVARASNRGGRIPVRTLAAFCRQMATMTESDLPIDEALGLLARDSNRKTAELATALRKAVLEGASLSSGLASSPQRVPDMMVGLVAAGEEGGALGPVFTRLADSFEMQIRTTDALRSALIYPAVLGITALASLVLVLTVVAPALKPVFAGAGDRMPLSAQILIGASEALRTYWWVGILAITLGIVLLVSSLRSPPGRAAMAGFSLKAPLIGPIVSSTEAARFLHALSALLDNGVSVVNALDIARRATSNPVVASEIERIGSRVRLGERLGDTLAKSKVFPPLAGQLASVGERSGSLAKMLRHGGRVMEETSQREVKQLMTVATPALTIILGVLVGSVVLSLLSAIMSVNDLAV
jgi:general secretion pathway protein F